SFPRATYVVQRGELEFARHTNERTAASYLPHNFEAVPFRLIDGQAEPLPGIRCLPTPGHVPYHQSILVESGGERLCFLADLVPTSAHLPLPWIMGYDLEPLVTLESKRRLYARAEGEGWLLMFEHDPAMVAGRLGRDGKAFALVDPLRAGSLSPDNTASGRLSAPHPLPLRIGECSRVEERRPSSVVRRPSLRITDACGRKAGRGC